jgi:hypothetical protein
MAVGTGLIEAIEEAAPFAVSVGFPEGLKIVAHTRYVGFDRHTRRRGLVKSARLRKF